MIQKITNKKYKIILKEDFFIMEKNFFILLSHDNKIKNKINEFILNKINSKYETNFKKFKIDFLNSYNNNVCVYLYN